MIRQTAKRRVSSETSIQAPTGGLNAKDPLANMKETEAVVMDNYFPRPSDVVSRNGKTPHVTGLPSAVDTLAVYASGTTKELFGISAGNIYNCTTVGVVGAAVVTGLNNSRFQTINFGTAGGFFLLCVNGLDKMQVYTGSGWYEDGTTTTVTGVDTADCVHINNFKNRVWLIEKESFNAWYLPVSSIGGAAAALDLSGIFKLGGYLMAMANWTIDNAAGIDDYAAFISSEGEVALYKGTDPTSAATWALVGTFRMGAPIGRRCFTKAGADVLVLTIDGAFPLSKSLLTDRSQLNLAATDKISDLINNDAIAYRNNFGWEALIYPTGNKLIINVPTTESSTSVQYVMNTTHGAWCRFTGWDAFCFEMMGDELYYGGNEGVWQADTGFSDDGAEITGVVQQAFSYFGSKGSQKAFKMARPILISQGSIVPAVLMNVDFGSRRTQSSSYTAGTSGTAWDEGFWDTSDWLATDIISKQWQSISGVGFSGGVKLSTALQNISCAWVSTDFIYEVGGSL
jgi:hypothetical protein